MLRWEQQAKAISWGNCKMTACAMLTYPNVNSAAWQCIKDDVGKQYGIIITTDKGTASKDSFTVQWYYDAVQSLLQIQMLDSPWYVSCSAIHGRINDLVEGCLKQHNIIMDAIVPG